MADWRAHQKVDLKVLQKVDLKVLQKAEWKVPLWVAQSVLSMVDL